MKLVTGVVGVKVLRQCRTLQVATPPTSAGFTRDDYVKCTAQVGMHEIGHRGSRG